MTVRFFDRQNTANPLNGTRISEANQLRELLMNTQGRAPFFAELIGENGFKLLLGLGGPEGCVQFGSANGTAPYFMALVPHADHVEGEMDFLIGDSASPVPKRYSLPNKTVVAIAEQFLESGRRPETVDWQEI